MNGWISLYRSLLDWEWFSNSEMVHLFIYFLLKANHEPNKWQGIELSRGQFITGREKIKSETGIPESTIRTCIERLKKSDVITVKTTNKYSIITVCNYDSYQQVKIENDQQNDQQKDQQKDQQNANKTPTKRQQNTTTNNDNNYNNKNKESVFVEPTKKITPQTVDEEINYTEVEATKKETEQGKGGGGKKFVRPTIDEVESYIKEKGYSIDAERFVSYYESNGWKVGKNPMKDWKMAVVTWSKNDNQRTNNYKTFEKQPYRHPITTILSDELSREQLEKFERNRKDFILSAQNKQVDT
jgi:predicted transcriptional regulator